MLDSYFLPYQQIMIGGALVFYFLSVYFFEFKKKETLAVVFLLIGTLVFKSFVITLDEFINLWDEQFHALVAKNLSKDLFVPKLYPDPVLPYDFNNWMMNHVWLHKQPFFMMQMAVTIKLFGANAFAVRFPSVLCMVLATYSIYRIGVNTLTSRIGFIGALLFSMNYFFNEMMVGAEPTDHNDIVFMCYVTASVWALTEYLKTPSKKWMIWIALFSSFAVLTKWLPGYLVFGLWVMYLIQQRPIFGDNLKNWFALIKTFLMAAILPAIWQIYTALSFPNEYGREYEFMSRHITEVLENHSGTELFHLEALKKVIGYYSVFFVLLGIILIRKYLKDPKMYLSFIFSVAVVYIFFTLVATKMVGFTFITFFVFFLGFGSIGQSFYEYIRADKNIFGKIVYVGILVYIGIAMCGLESLQSSHTLWKKDNFGMQNFRDHNVNWYKTCQEMKKELGDERYVVFNCGDIDAVKLMFYTDHIGYNQIPDFFEINLAKIKNYKVAVMDGGNLPAYIMNDKSIVKLKDVKYKIVSKDTVTIKLDNGKFLYAHPNNKLTENNEPTEFVITTFANNSSQLSTLNGKILTSQMDYGGMMLFTHKNYEIYEQMILQPIGKNKFILRTLFNEDLEMVAKDTCFFSTRYAKKQLTIEVSKL